MAGLRLLWMGPPNAERDGRAIKLETRKALALLAYLSVSPEPCPRETLATLLWPEHDQRHAHANLRRALESLARRLGPGVLHADRETAGVLPGAEIWVDAVAFRQGIPSTATSASSADEEARVALYRGDFLEGLNLPDCPSFDEWQFFQREDLRRGCAQALERLATAYAARGEWPAAIGHARRWVALDPLHEPAQRALIELYARAGQRSAALRQYAECARLLQDELAQEPEAATRELYAQVRAGMSGPTPAPAPASPELLQTKLHAPQLRPAAVQRPRLTMLLDRADARLTLISAPAGFGKTTLVAGWAAASPEPVAWLSLDEGDNDPALFLRYLLAAVEGLCPGATDEPRALLRLSSAAPTAAVLTSLINQLSLRASHARGADARPVTLVLDDYHCVVAQPVHDVVTFLLDHLPPALRLIVTTRADPPLPLARLRARDQLVEVRADDLRFTPREASDFLTRVMGLALDERDLLTLGERTEGWCAGLQMAALSLRGHRDPEQFIASFSGSQRYILDYLGEEVLGRQSADMQAFLLPSAVLDRLSGPLCDEVLERSGSQALLARLEKANLFLVPLDDAREWYRYHHLFADLLRSRLQQQWPAQDIGALHRRAALWFESHGSSSEAIGHALASQDADLAADLVERALRGYAAWSSGDVVTVAGWLRALPPGAVRTRPWLRAYASRALYMGGDLAAAEDLLREVDEALRCDPDAVPDGGLLLAVLSRNRAIYAAARGRPRDALACAQQAREYLPSDPNHRAITAYALADAYLQTGEVAQARRACEECLAASQAAGNGLFAILSAWLLAEVHLAGAELRAALRACDESARLGTVGGVHVPLTAAAELTRAMVYYERNQLEPAERCVAEALETLRLAGLTDNHGLGHIRLALVKQARGDAAGARQALGAAEDIARASGIERVIEEVAVARARLALAQGDTQAAVRWADLYRARLPDAAEYLRDRADLMLARVLLATAGTGAERYAEALAVLDRLLTSAESGERRYYVLEALTLQAGAYAALGDVPAARAGLERALALAEPEGYVRVFADGGRPVATLLAQLPAGSPHRPYADRLLAVTALHERPAGPPVRESLTPRELEVLRLLADGLTNAQVAKALVIAPGTVRAHTASIYGKLDAANRTQAVARAHSLKLL